jgi:predicted ATP-grasp superfamily ATP-dependent carboligase
MNIAVVLSMSEAGLAVTRSLGRRGIKVFGVDYKSDAENFSSKYCDRQLIFSNPETHPEKCLEEFLALGRTLKEKAVLLPTNDYYTKFISRNRIELSEYYLFIIPTVEVLEGILDKQKQYERAEQLGICIPKTFAPLDLGHLEEMASSISYPVYIKGANSYLWFWQFRNKGFLAANYQELKQYYESAVGKNLKSVVQEIVIGPNTNHFEVNAYYSAQKELVGLFCTQKARQYPIDFGNGTFMISKKLPELSSLARRLFEGIGYMGAGVIEFKKDERDGRFKLLELNPRFTQQYFHAAVAGIDFAHMNYLECVGKKPEPAMEYEEDILYVDLFLDLLSFLQHRKQGYLTFTQWWRSVRKADCVEYFSRDDLKPGIHYLLRSGRRFLKKILHKS